MLASIDTLPVKRSCTENSGVRFDCTWKTDRFPRFKDFTFFPEVWWHKHAAAQRPPLKSGAEGGFHHSSCYQPFMQPGEQQLGKLLQILEEIV